VSDLVPADQIEQIVGAKRHLTTHYARAVSAEEVVYILHSQECKNSGIDLRECSFSTALDRGIVDLPVWDGAQDQTVALAIRGGRLVPLRVGGGDDDA